MTTKQTAKSKAKAAPAKTADEWNDKVPLGTLVDYWPDADQIGETRFRLRRRTRSVAWRLGHGAPVVKLEGVPGGVSIEHLRLVPEKEMAAHQRKVSALVADSEAFDAGEVAGIAERARRKRDN